MIKIFYKKKDNRFIWPQNIIYKRIFKWTKTIFNQHYFYCYNYFKTYFPNAFG